MQLQTDKLMSQGCSQADAVEDLDKMVFISPSLYASSLVLAATQIYIPALVWD